LSYAELSSLFPRAGAEFEYSSKAFGKRIGFVIGLLTIFAGIIGSAAVSLGFARYLNSLTGLPVLVVAVGLVIFLSAMIFLGIKNSSSLAIIFTIIASLGLGAVIFVGLPYLGTINYFEVSEVNGLVGVVSAASLIFFAFIGFDSIVNLAEDVKNAEKNIPLAVILAIIISTTIYILVSISAISIMPWEQLALSNAPLADVMGLVLGNEAATILAFIALFATASTVLLLLIAMSRIVFGMAREGSLPFVLSNIHTKTNSPWLAIFLVGLITIIFVVIENIEFIANLTNFAIFVIFISMNLAVIKFRYSMPDKKRLFKTPINIGKFPVLPLIGLFICLYLLISIGTEVIIYGILLILICAIIDFILSKTNLNKIK
jgi:basic amino acid/polyamine antiporter, APA family